mmetsp:Transcript_32500/g.68342  ORF Transcript_32500/g.68342 Transcript_32500/m.68342 type:complete len:113 (+) Transcript_32500:170-508(+)
MARQALWSNARHNNCGRRGTSTRLPSQHRKQKEPPETISTIKTIRFFGRKSLPLPSLQLNLLAKFGQQQTHRGHQSQSQQDATQIQEKQPPKSKRSSKDATQTKERQEDFFP